LTSAEDAGLSTAEAASRLRRDGPNVLADTQSKGLLALLAALVAEPMIALLLGAVALYLVLGEIREALLMGGSVLAILALTLVTEWRTERAARALRELGSPRALVIRDGVPTRIAGAEVVVGDLVQIDEGDRVPADGELLPGAAGELLRVDESLLTGESAPITKDAASEVGRRLLAGTLVAFGGGRMRVSATGRRTRMGALGARLGELAPEASPLRRDIDRLVRLFAALGLGASLLLVAWLALSGTPITEALLSGIGLAIGMIPEEYPVILTVFLAIGAWRMAREHVLVRRLPAIEALGATTVLCVDKTGTLTLNRMRLSALWTPTGGHRSAGPALDEEARRLLAAGAAASRHGTSEPMDAALSAAAEEAGLAPRGEPTHEYPFGKLERAEGLDEELSRALSRSAARAWRGPPGSPVVLGLKGALEAVLHLAHASHDARDAYVAAASELAAAGLRVLAIAGAEHDPTAPLPACRAALPWQLLGLVGIADPVREEVPAAVRACLGAGVRVVMITGDHPETARAIARAAGIAPIDLLTGSELDLLSGAALSARLATLTVVARAHPEHKLRLVEALSARGEVVAMTGDGVNDALALKAATIGIAMGARGTDVAREAASIVLADDRFDSIVAGLRRGRRIFENLQRASGFVLMVHVVLAGLALVPVALGHPAALLPLHIVLLELIVDPSCSIVFEREPAPADLLTRPPRDPRASVLERREVVPALAAGLACLVVIVGLYVAALDRGGSPESARLTAFLGVVTALVASIPLGRVPGTVRSDAGSRRALAALVVAVLAGLGLLVGAPSARSALHWAMPELLPLLVTLVALPSVIGLVYRLAPRATRSRAHPVPEAP
jgi:Ca2+-transporting ATPase